MRIQEFFRYFNPLVNFKTQTKFSRLTTSQKAITIIATVIGSLFAGVGGIAVFRFTVKQFTKKNKNLTLREQKVAQAVLLHISHPKTTNNLNKPSIVRSTIEGLRNRKEAHQQTSSTSVDTSKDEHLEDDIRYNRFDDNEVLPRNSRKSIERTEDSSNNDSWLEYEVSDDEISDYDDIEEADDIDDIAESIDTAHAEETISEVSTQQIQGYVQDMLEKSFGSAYKDMLAPETLEYFVAYIRHENTCKNKKLTDISFGIRSILEVDCGVKFFKQSSYKLVPGLNQGDCFYDAIRIGLLEFGREESVSLLRKQVQENYNRFFSEHIPDNKKDEVIRLFEELFKYEGSDRVQKIQDVFSSRIKKIFTGTSQEYEQFKNIHKYILNCGENPNNFPKDVIKNENDSSNPLWGRCGIEGLLLELYDKKGLRLQVTEAIINSEIANEGLIKYLYVFTDPSIYKDFMHAARTKINSNDTYNVFYSLFLIAEMNKKACTVEQQQQLVKALASANTIEDFEKEVEKILEKQYVSQRKRKWQDDKTHYEELNKQLVVSIKDDGHFQTLLDIYKHPESLFVLNETYNQKINTGESPSQLVYIFAQTNHYIAAVPNTTVS